MAAVPSRRGGRAPAPACWERRGGGTGTGSGGTGSSGAGWARAGGRRRGAGTGPFRAAEKGGLLHPPRFVTREREWRGGTHRMYLHSV